LRDAPENLTLPVDTLESNVSVGVVGHPGAAQPPSSESQTADISVAAQDVASRTVTARHPRITGPLIQLTGGRKSRRSRLIRFQASRKFFIWF
jgi:hypothetical protein